VTPVREALHEAGHAVACVLTGGNMKYVTIVPDKVGAGHLEGSPADGWHESPAWSGFAVIIAAGMVAEAVGFDLDATDPDVVDYLRASAADGGGTGSRPVYDTATLRWIARSVWETARYRPIAVLGPEFRPEWADNPDGVRDIAAYCWATAVRLLCENAGTLMHVARKLNRAKTLTGDQVAKAIDSRRHRRYQINPDQVGTDFWLTDYTRLVWRPHGMCRTQKAGAR
jgi:hypothetical protein